MNSRQIVITVVGGILTIVLAVVVASAFIKMKAQPQKPPVQKIYRKVNSSLVAYGRVESDVQSTGRIISQQSVDIIAEVQGKLLPGTVPLKDGQDFRQGDILVNIYSRDAEYALQARKSGYLNLLANILPDLKIDYPEDYPQWVAFFESVETTADLPELPAVSSSQLKIFLASRNILSEYYAIKSDEIRLKKYAIRAPYDGAIQTVLLEVGSVANPGSRIAQVIKTAQLEVEVPMEATSASWLKIGDRAMLFSEDGNPAGEGRVTRISSYVDVSTQSINVYLSVTRRQQQLFPGEYLRVEFSGLNIADAMEIPRNAVFNRNMVFVVEDDGFLSKKQVNLLKINERTVIFNGLPVGAEVVTEPLANANENVQVQTEYTVPPEPEPTDMEAAAAPAE